VIPQVLADYNTTGQSAGVRVKYGGVVDPITYGGDGDNIFTHRGSTNATDITWGGYAYVRTMCGEEITIEGWANSTSLDWRDTCIIVFGLDENASGCKGPGKPGGIGGTPGPPNIPNPPGQGGIPPGQVKKGKRSYRGLKGILLKQR
jgi:hypothetical protein